MNNNVIRVVVKRHDDPRTFRPMNNRSIFPLVVKVKRKGRSC